MFHAWEIFELVLDDLMRKLGKAKRDADYQRARYAKIRAWALHELGDVCFYCHGTKDLEIHDLEPVFEGRGKRRGWTTLKRWLTLIPQGKMRLVCRECHVEHEHNGNTNELKKVKRDGT